MSSQDDDAGQKDNYEKKIDSDPVTSKKENQPVDDEALPNSSKIVHSEKRRKGLIIFSYVIGLVSLSLALLGICFAIFWLVAHARYHAIQFRSYLWVWICTIAFGALFLIDVILVLCLKGKKHVGSLKRLLAKRFLIPLIVSAVICSLMGIICGASYYHYLSSEWNYMNADSSVSTMLSRPTTILGAAYNQCYPTEEVKENNYQIDTYQTFISGSGVPTEESDAGAMNAIIEFGCLLNALNINNSKSGNSLFETLLKNSNSQDGAAKTVYPYRVFLSTYSSNGQLSTVGMFSVVDIQMSGYRYNTAVLPKISTINTSATFNSSIDPVMTTLENTLGEGDTSELDNEDSGSSTSSNSNGGSELSTGPTSNSLAATAISDAESCYASGDQNSLFPGDNPNTSFYVGGTNLWGSLMSCVAETTGMPTSVETQLNNFISSDVAALEGGPSLSGKVSESTNWTLGDGSVIYLDFGGPQNSTGGWSAHFSLNPIQNN